MVPLCFLTNKFEDLPKSTEMHYKSNSNIVSTSECWFFLTWFFRSEVHVMERGSRRHKNVEWVR